MEATTETKAKMTTDADLDRLIARGELYLVEDGEALLVTRSLADERTRGYSRGEFGIDWILIAAETGKKALAMAARYDADETCDLRDSDVEVAICEMT